jgi:hypothetical protein
MIEQGGEDRTIAHALERIGRRRLKQLARLGIAERRRFTFVAFDLGCFRLKPRKVNFYQK